MKTLVATLAIALCMLGQVFSQIEAGKMITVEIRGVPLDEKGRIDGDYTVADNGNIDMPFIGQVRAAGVKPETLAATLASRYKAADIYTNPTFQVVANREGAGLNEQAVIVGGQIARPGLVPFQRGLTLWQAIQQAGGPTPFGTLKRVKVTRSGKQRQYDVTQLEAQQIQLEPKDSIDIPHKGPFDMR
jgi:polysaccharide export outer membrane protein